MATAGTVVPCGETGPRLATRQSAGCRAIFGRSTALPGVQPFSKEIRLPCAEPLSREVRLPCVQPLRFINVTGQSSPTADASLTFSRASERVINSRRPHIPTRSAPPPPLHPIARRHTPTRAGYDWLEGRVDLTPAPVFSPREGAGRRPVKSLRAASARLIMRKFLL